MGNVVNTLKINLALCISNTELISLPVSPLKYQVLMMMQENTFFATTLEN